MLDRRLNAFHYFQEEEKRNSKNSFAVKHCLIGTASICLLHACTVSVINLMYMYQESEGRILTIIISCSGAKGTRGPEGEFKKY